VARIEEAGRIPWLRFALGIFLGLGAVVLIGGGVFSLILAVIIVALVSKGRISYRKNPMDK
jgi:hypothetical protein